MGRCWGGSWAWADTGAPRGALASAPSEQHHLHLASGLVGQLAESVTG